MKYCAKCGAPVPEKAHFCSRCGSEIGAAPATIRPRKPADTIAKKSTDDGSRRPTDGKMSFRLNRKKLVAGLALILIPLALIFFVTSRQAERLAIPTGELRFPSQEPEVFEFFQELCGQSEITGNGPWQCDIPDKLAPSGTSSFNYEGAMGSRLLLSTMNWRERDPSVAWAIGSGMIERCEGWRWDGTNLARIFSPGLTTSRWGSGPVRWQVYAQIFGRFPTGTGWARDAWLPVRISAMIEPSAIRC